MKYVHIKNNQAVDIATDPANQFHPDLAIKFVEAPDEVQRGWVQDDSGNWSAPTEPTPPSRKWYIKDIRKNLSLSEKVSWDNDSAPEIKTAKNEFKNGLEEAETIEVLAFLVAANLLSETSKNNILA